MKKDVAGDGAYVSERVGIVYGEVREALAHLPVLAEQCGEPLKNRFAELKSEYADMPTERLLEEFAIAQAYLEFQLRMREHLEQSLLKAAQGLGLLHIVGEQAITEHASDRATRGHAETHDAKRDVFQWCDRHHHEYPRNMNGMATAIAGIVVPYKWDTVRAWITEWKKERKLGAASKPDSN
jgi:hypothetical protein